MRPRWLMGYDERDAAPPQEATPMGDLQAPEMVDDSVSPLDLADPVALPAAAPKPLDPNAVPPELRADYKPPPLQRPVGRSADLAAASANDRRRQNQADVRAYLLAAGRREAPQLQKLGTPETDTIEKQIAHQPKAEDPLSREMMLMNVLKARKELAKPEDETGADLRKAELAKILYDLQHPKDPNAEKPGEFLDPAEVPAMDKRYGAQFDGGQLPRDSNGRVRRDLVLRLAAPSETAAVTGGIKQGIAAANRGQHERLFQQGFAEQNNDQDIQRVQQLAKEVGSSPSQIKGAIADLNGYLGQKDIPGIGAGQDFVPEVFRSDEAIHVRNRATNMVNTLLNIISGTGVSDQERKNQYRLYGLVGGNAQAFRDGLARLKQDAAASLQAKQSGFDPKTVQHYRAQGGLLPSDIDPTIKPRPDKADAAPRTFTVIDPDGRRTPGVTAAQLEELKKEKDWAGHMAVSE